VKIKVEDLPVKVEKVEGSLNILRKLKSILPFRM
jgi:hypothetical protein